MAKPFNYGGQAVIEGVMMRGPDRYSVAVRREDGQIVVDKRSLLSVLERSRVLKLPLLRGTVALIEALVLGVRALTYSASQAAAEEEEELNSWEIFLTITVAIGLAVLLFVVVPTWTAHLLRGSLNNFGENLVEGVIRVVVFVAYILAISRMKDIQRVFQYHGAEHKTIHAYEAGDELVAVRVQQYSTLHPRCGTSFLLYVLVLTVVIFSFLQTDALWWRILSRIMLLPLVAGIGYEIIRLSGKYGRNPFVAALSAPGLWLQKLTTREPDDAQVEVAISALQAVLPAAESKPAAVAVG